MRGDLNAKYMLALAYLNGEGATRNQQEGARLMVEAADLGYLPAQYGLGVLFLEGKGRFRNHAMAYAWFLICNNKWQRVYGRSMGFRNEELDGNIHCKIGKSCGSGVG